MSTTNLKKVSTYTRMGCDTLAIDFSYKILYTTLIFIYKNLNILFTLTCSWQYKNATASCRQNLRIFKTTSHEPIVLKLGQLQVELTGVILPFATCTDPWCVIIPIGLTGYAGPTHLGSGNWFG